MVALSTDDITFGIGGPYRSKWTFRHNRQSDNEYNFATVHARQEMYVKH
jgi:hypothetical protein